MNNTEQKERIYPDWRIVLRDETQYWTDPELVKRCGGTIKGASLFDANRQVHCCEITPSFELERLNSVPKQWPDDERTMESLEAELREADFQADSGCCSYVHVSDMDLESDSVINVWKMTDKEWQALLDDADGDEEKAHDVAMAACQEYISGNGFY